MAIDVQDLGDSEEVLKNRALLGETARALMERGIVPTEDGWGGWLGRYQTALAKSAKEHARSQERRDLKSPERKRVLARGR
jgi:hypothetical protein